MTQLADTLDAITAAIGRTVRWLVLAMVLLQFAVVIARYLFGISYVFASEAVLYMHAALFMAGAGYTLQTDEHVRVDIFYAKLNARYRAIVNALGTIFLLLPSLVTIAWWSWPTVRNSWAILEGPISVGGIPASFLVKTLIPVFCLLIAVGAIAGLARDITRLKQDVSA